MLNVFVCGQESLNALAMVCSVICECGISWPCSLFFYSLLFIYLFIYFIYFFWLGMGAGLGGVLCGDIFYLWLNLICHIWVSSRENLTLLSSNNKSADQSGQRLVYFFSEKQYS